MPQVSLHASSNVKRSKVKVTGKVNAVIKTQPYIPNGKAYEFQTSLTDGARRPALTCAMISKLKPLDGCSSHRLHGVGHIVTEALQAAQLVRSG